MTDSRTTSKQHHLLHPLALDLGRLAGIPALSGILHRTSWSGRAGGGPWAWAAEERWANKRPSLVVAALALCRGMCIPSEAAPRLPGCPSFSLLPPWALQESNQHANRSMALTKCSRDFGLADHRHWRGKDNMLTAFPLLWQIGLLEVCAARWKFSRKQTTCPQPRKAPTPAWPPPRRRHMLEVQLTAS
jgi:hypothetical protein